MNDKNINRRQFLKGLTGAAVGAIGFPYIIRSSALGKAG
ncbi:MAG: twin-arginine translocation signal domain-containing protein, partial [Planctomycetota bacterium]